MKRLFYMCFLALFSDLLISQTPIDDLNWSPDLLINDNFNSMDWQTWRVMHNWWPTKENFTSTHVLTNIIPGLLHLKAEQVNGSPPFYDVGGLITNSTDYPYGYYEIKWQLPDSYGRWLTFWLLGNSGREIDILENVDVSNTQWGSNVHNNSVTPNFHASQDIPYWSDVDVPVNFSTSQNKIGLEWSPGIVIFYLNDVPYKEIWYDNRIPDPSGMALLITPGIDDSPFPNLWTPDYTIIDWVKVWILKRNLVSTIINSNQSLSLYDYALNTSITFQQNVSIPSQQNLTFRATDHITIDGEFTVPAGSGCTFIVHDDVQ